MAFITSAFFCAFSFAGLFSGSLFNRYGLRAVGLLGGGLYFFGSLLQIFVRSIWELLFAFSIIQGIGFGLIVPTSYTTFNNYFVKKRVMWMSFAQSLIGVGTMFYPVGMQKLMELYGFRGCLLVLAAINSHAILGMLLMQPVKWHMRKMVVQTEQTFRSTYNSESEKERNEDITLTLSKTINNNEYMKYGGLDASGLDPNNLSLLNHDELCTLTLPREDLKKISSRSSSITSLGNWTGPIVVRDASPEMTRFHSTLAVNIQRGESEEKPSCWKVIVDFLDLQLLKKPIYVNIVLGISFALYSDIAFFTLQPLYLFELGFTKARIILLCIVLLNILKIFSRTLPALSPSVPLLIWLRAYS